MFPQLSSLVLLTCCSLQFVYMTQIQIKSMDLSFTDPEGVTHNQLLMNDDDRMIIELDGDSDKPVTFVFDKQQGALGVYTPSADECHYVPGVDTNSYNVDETEGQDTLTYVKTDAMSEEDRSLLPVALRAMCADRPVFWGQVAEGEAAAAGQGAAGEEQLGEEDEPAAEGQVDMASETVGDQFRPRAAAAGCRYRIRIICRYVRIGSRVIRICYRILYRVCG